MNAVVPLAPQGPLEPIDIINHGKKQEKEAILNKKSIEALVNLKCHPSFIGTKISKRVRKFQRSNIMALVQHASPLYITKFTSSKIDARMQLYQQSPQTKQSIIRAKDHYYY